MHVEIASDNGDTFFGVICFLVKSVVKNLVCTMDVHILEVYGDGTFGGNEDMDVHSNAFDEFLRFRRRENNVVC